MGEVRSIMISSLGIKVAQPSGSCSDPYCPYHGHLKVRGKVIVGRVQSLRMKKAAVIGVEYPAYNSKFTRFERRGSTIHARVPSCVTVSVGDLVAIAECRPLGKNLSHIMLGKVTV
ncbi:MAG: 30S ribosomal protein S17 [Nitrososphaerota archaeon]|jgi:small subunit ribosomal protein S17|nr:30S ribosomal protein S17 [Nitrososphaerota archaeon]MDG6926885.1 30S ribosomal protein S17 [Nitrososphaerota archaeon]MDG6931948.1 30S ribosomal protein S17 [Nitrososphaerota archaeon]MDG6943849.1 30S ribosomal protein S17 [Nitrososphaerota archaeon]